MRLNVASGRRVSQRVLSFCATGVGYAAIYSGPRHSGLVRSLLTRPGDSRNTQELSRTRSGWNWCWKVLRALEQGSQTQAPGSESHVVLLLLESACFFCFLFFSVGLGPHLCSAFLRSDTSSANGANDRRQRLGANWTFHVSRFIRGCCSFVRQKQAALSLEGKPSTETRKCFQFRNHSHGCCFLGRFRRFGGARGCLRRHDDMAGSC